MNASGVERHEMSRMINVLGDNIGEITTDNIENVSRQENETSLPNIPDHGFSQIQSK